MEELQFWHVWRRVAQGISRHIKDIDPIDFLQNHLGQKAMAKPAQQSMEAHLVEDSDEETGLEEMDVEANLCCPDALSAVLSTVFSPCWLCSLKMISQNERAVAWICGMLRSIFLKWKSSTILGVSTGDI